MSRARSWGLTLTGVCASFLIAGCGTKTVPVKGVVTVDDKPLANASVLFISQEEGGRDANGFTDANGAFRLSTFRAQDGALPGLYKVTVNYSDPIEVDPSLTTAEEVQAAMAKAEASRKPSLVLPPIYTQPDKTVLKHRVPEDGDVKLELKSAKR